MRKVFINMTITFDGFIAGPNNELDWMVRTQDKEMLDDSVALYNGIEGGIIGYPTAIGMMAYWSEAAKNPSASKGEHAIADAVNKLHAILVSNKEEKLASDNTELLVVKNDKDLIEAVSKIKKQPGGDLAVSGGVRTVQNFVRLGLCDEYVLAVHPVAIGNGKRLFTNRVNLETVDVKTYKSGVMRIKFVPAK